MEHGEAVQQKATERYLLNELTPDARDAYEEHLFDCTECAMDLRAASAFMDEAKVQLPALLTREPARERRNWFAWAGPLLTPAFAAPAFAALILLIGYQNLVQFPAQRATAGQPRLLTQAALHLGARGDATVIETDRGQGVSLSVDLPQRDGITSYALTLTGPDGKQLAIGSIDAGQSTAAVEIPGAGLQPGKYTLAVSGAGAPISQADFEIQFAK